MGSDGTGDGLSSPGGQTRGGGAGGGGRVLDQRHEGLPPWCLLPTAGQHLNVRPRRRRRPRSSLQCRQRPRQPCGGRRDALSPGRHARQSLHGPDLRSAPQRDHSDRARSHRGRLALRRGHDLHLGPGLPGRARGQSGVRHDPHQGVLHHAAVPVARLDVHQAGHGVPRRHAHGGRRQRHGRRDAR